MPACLAQVQAAFILKTIFPYMSAFLLKSTLEILFQLVLPRCLQAVSETLAFTTFQHLYVNLGWRALVDLPCSDARSLHQ